MERDDNAQQHRLRNKKKSNASKLAWRRNHGNYMRGVRKRERDSMNKSFYDVCRQLDEADVKKDNVFDTELTVGFDSIAGGIAMSINKDNGNVSFSTSLIQSGSGMYRLTDFDADTLKTLYTNIRGDIIDLCNHFDEELQMILAKNGLKSTK